TLPGAVPEVRGHPGRPRAPRPLRADAAAAGRGCPRRVAVHAPAAGRDQEGRPGHLEGPAAARDRSVRGRLGPVAASPAVRRSLVRRVVALVATLGFVSVLVFAAIRVLPGDPVLVMAGPEANPEVVARLRAAMGLDRPLVVQYAEWLAGALRGELGTSLQYDVPVGALIVSRLPVTLPLTALAAFFTLAFAVPLGEIGRAHV